MIGEGRSWLVPFIDWVAKQTRINHSTLLSGRLGCQHQAKDFFFLALANTTAQEALPLRAKTRGLDLSTDGGATCAQCQGPFFSRKVF